MSDEKINELIKGKLFVKVEYSCGAIIACNPIKAEYGCLLCSCFIGCANLFSINNKLHYSGADTCTNITQKEYFRLMMALQEQNLCFNKNKKVLFNRTTLETVTNTRTFTEKEY